MMATEVDASAGEAGGSAQPAGCRGDPSGGTGTGARARGHPSAPVAHDNFLVVGVGASAGGLTAFRTLLEHLPRRSGIALVFVQHLDPSHDSALPALLQRYTEMEVVEVTEDTGLEPDHLYVMAPNKELTIEKGVLRTRALRRRAPRTPLDQFLRALAGDLHERAAAVILSGSGSDGMLGCRAIRANGGIVLAQRPETARYRSMPASTAHGGLADFVLPVKSIPEVLLRYARHPQARAASSSAAAPEAEQHLSAILTALRVRARQDFHGYKKSMLHRRIVRRMGLHRIDGLAAYRNFVLADDVELRRLAQDMLVRFSGFFREPGAYRVLEREVIPRIVKGRSDSRPIRVWVPGCTSGEEAYSLGMLLLEHLGSVPAERRLQVFATDIDDEAVRFARSGFYPEGIAKDLTNRRLNAFFDREDHGFRVRPALRERMIFSVQDLLSDPPFSRLDLVSCRNLLIYLEPEAQRRVLALLHFALAPGGYLFLGGSEAIREQRDLFEAVSGRHRIYRRVDRARPAITILPARSKPQRGDLEPRPAPARDRPREHRRRLIERLARAHPGATAVLVDSAGEAVYFQGEVSQYLNFPRGEPTLRVTELAPLELRARLRSALRQVQRTHEPLTLESLQLRRANGGHFVRVTLCPIEGGKEAQGWVLVAFEASAPPSTPGPRPSQAAGERDASLLVAQLEEEIAATRHDLQGTIAELQGTNEDLQQANEELRSVNEELNAANEELETSKEELQSLNDELQSAHTQLQQKVRELEAANDDLANLLDSTDAVTLFVDADLRIKRFTPSATGLFELGANSIGRWIGEVHSRSNDETLLADMQAVLAGESVPEREVASTDGRWHLRRVLPYRTVRGSVEGVVLTLTEITPLKSVEAQLREFNRTLERRVAWATQYVQLLRDVTGMANQSESLSKAMRAVMERVCRYCGWAAGHAWLLSDPEQRAHSPLEVWYLSPGHGRALVGARRAAGARAEPIERVRAAKRPEWVSEPGGLLRLSARGARRIGSAVVAPLLLGTRVVGLLEFFSTARRRPEPRILDLLHQIGLELAEVVERHRLHERQVDLGRVARYNVAGQLATGLAHELNQPLTALLADVDVVLRALRAERSDPRTLIESLEAIDVQGRRAAEIVQHMRHFIRTHTPQRRAFNLNHVIEGTVHLTRTHIERHGVTLRTELADELPLVLADGVQVEQVLVNLVNNAIDAMIGQSRQVLTVRTLQATPKSIEVAVSDTGPGVPEEKRARLFEPFFTTKPDGIGLGLVIVRSIVEAQGGKVSATRNRGAGMTFRFTLPVAPPESTSSPATTSETESK